MLTWHILNEWKLKLEIDIQNEINQAISTIEKCFNDYDQKQICIAFNGGKDCTVVLYLIEAVLDKLTVEKSKYIKLQDIVIVVFHNPDEFEEVHEFVEQVEQKLQITIYRCASSHRAGLEELYDKGIRSVIMGQRKSDPHGSSIELFSLCTDGWPKIMRVNPILYWSYSTLWRFLRELKLDYCKLYDDGYTSLGSKKFTMRHPSLVQNDGSIRPAYELTDGDVTERHARN